MSYNEVSPTLHGLSENDILRLQFSHTKQPKMKELKYTIESQGAVEATTAEIKIKHEDICLLVLYTKTKYCEVCATTDDAGFYLTTTERTHSWKDGDKDDTTKISFPEFKGWEVVATWSSKYTHTLTLVKSES